jgi:hypothetical protein
MCRCQRIINRLIEIFFCGPRSFRFACVYGNRASSGPEGPRSQLGARNRDREASASLVCVATVLLAGRKARAPSSPQHNFPIKSSNPTS